MMDTKVIGQALCYGAHFLISEEKSLKELCESLQYLKGIFR